MVAAAPEPENAGQAAQAGEAEETGGAEQDDTLCGCSGNCGCGACIFKKNMNRSQPSESKIRICTNAKLPGHRFCSRCECEADTCTAPRNYSAGQGRWCLGCRHERAEQGIHATTYWTAHGKQKFESHWPLLIKIVASWGFVLRFLTPLDLTAFAAFGRAQALQLGTALAPSMLTLLFLTHAVKWPTVINYLCPEASGRVVAADLLEYLTKGMRFADHKTWPSMFHGMNTGSGSERLKRYFLFACILLAYRFLFIFVVVDAS